MSLVGNLEDLGLGDILQIVSLSRRTGIITLETAEGRSMIIIKDGLVVSASCASPQIKNLGDILLERDLLTKSQLKQLLDLQIKRGTEPLGSLLVEAGVIGREDLEQIITNQIHNIVGYLMNINEGRFSFDLSEVIPFDNIRYNPMDSVLEKGLNPQQLLLENARIKDEKKRFQTQKMKQDDTEAELRIPPPKQVSFVTEEIEQDINERPLTLQDLQMPETSDLPDIPFDLIAEELDIPAAKENVSLPIIAPPATGPEISVLLIDDETFIRQIMARRLQERGFSVYQSDNTVEAIGTARDLIAIGRTLWIVCDLVMPTTAGNGFLGGLEVVEAVRRHDTSAPILIMSDYEDSKARTRALSLGVHYYLKKPVLSKLEIHHRETQIRIFCDSVIESLQNPPHPVKESEQAEKFWGDLSLETETADKQPASAANILRHMSALKGIMEELRSPKQAPGISLLILRYAAEFFDRAVLFLAKKDELKGLGGFGETGEIESIPQKVRNIKLPLSSDSIFSEVAKIKEIYLGKLQDTAANRQFINSIGRLIPPEVAILPVVSQDQVIAMVYGDNAISKKPIRDLEAMEIFMIQAGIAMENAFLQRKLDGLHSDES